MWVFVFEHVEILVLKQLVSCQCHIWFFEFQLLDLSLQNLNLNLVLPAQVGQILRVIVDNDFVMLGHHR